MYKATQAGGTLDKGTGVMSSVGRNKNEVTLRYGRKHPFGQKESFAAVANADFIFIVIMESGYVLGARERSWRGIEIEIAARRDGNGVKMDVICLFLHDCCAPFQ